MADVISRFIETRELNQFILLVSLVFCRVADAQKLVYIIDSVSGIALVGGVALVEDNRIIMYSDIEGKLRFIGDYKDSTWISFSMIGYEKKNIRFRDLPQTILLSPKVYKLKETIIYPMTPRRYIEMAFDSFQKNHVPFSFKQEVFFREEYIVNDDYLRFQEMMMNIYQFPKSDDSRKYYISGSYPEIKNIYRLDNVKKIAEIKESMGKLLSPYMNWNILSSYSYVKGTNILNLVFTILLDDPQTVYTLLPDENVGGYSALHIQGTHFVRGHRVFSSHILLEKQSMAVLQFSVLDQSSNIVKKLLSFKMKLALWLLGIKMNVNKYYCKILFEKNKDNFWTVSDFMAMCSFKFKRNTPLDVLILMNYRMNPSISNSSIPSGAELYGKSHKILDNYHPQKRFVSEVKYAIPLTPLQEERLKNMFIPR